MVYNLLKSPGPFLTFCKWNVVEFWLLKVLFFFWPREKIEKLPQDQKFKDTGSQNIITDVFLLPTEYIFLISTTSIKYNTRKRPTLFSKSLLRFCYKISRQILLLFFSTLEEQNHCYFPITGKTSTPYLHCWPLLEPLLQKKERQKD